MRRMQGWIALLVLMAAGPLRAAESCPDTGERFGDARRIVADLNRIVAPEGVQEAWAQDAGGIRQWVTARGQDRANPVILFVHGGPASPLTPTLWQFSRPLEEYFTVVTYDQRAAGKTFLLNPLAAVAGTLQVERYVDDAIAIAEGTKSTCASTVPARRLNEIHTIVRRNSGSLTLPSTTSSVITESCGSINANSRIVANTMSLPRLRTPFMPENGVSRTANSGMPSRSQTCACIVSNAYRSGTKYTEAVVSFRSSSRRVTRSSGRMGRQM